MEVYVRDICLKCGGTGIHNGLKIRRLEIIMSVQLRPSLPINLKER